MRWQKTLARHRRARRTLSAPRRVCGMRKRPDVRGEYMQMLPDGAVIVAVENESGRIKTTYKGYTGWVSGEYCCKAGED